MTVNDQQLDRMFFALSDTTRRGILAQLANGETSIGRLAEPYNISAPAISRHMRILEQAGSSLEQVIDITTYHLDIHAHIDAFMAAINAMDLDAATANIALRSFGAASDVAEAVCFLASRRAGYISGQVLNVDGGYSV